MPLKVSVADPVSPRPRRIGDVIDRDGVAGASATATSVPAQSRTTPVDGQDTETAVGAPEGALEKSMTQKLPVYGGNFALVPTTTTVCSAMGAPPLHPASARIGIYT